MHNTQIVYKFKKGMLEDGIKIWEEAVYNKVQEAEGFVRIQLYTREDEMMAIGTWQEKTFAENFMKTGVFKDIMASFGELLVEQPINKTYELRYFESK